MSKKIAVFLSMLALVTIVGGGCAKEQSENKNENKTVSSTPLTLDSENAKTDDIVLAVEKNGAGKVKMNWQTNIQPTKGWHIMNSARSQSKQPFWQLVGNGKNEYDWSGISTGKRYFRVCEWTGTECGKMSNEVELEVE